MYILQLLNQLNLQMSCSNYWLVFYMLINKFNNSVLDASTILLFRQKLFFTDFVIFDKLLNDELNGVLNLFQCWFNWWTKHISYHLCYYALFYYMLELWLNASTQLNFSFVLHWTQYPTSVNATCCNLIMISLFNKNILVIRIMFH